MATRRRTRRTKRGNQAEQYLQDLVVSTVQKYARQSPAAASFLRNLGSLGNLISVIGSIFTGRTPSKATVERAIEIILSKSGQQAPGRGRRAEVPPGQPQAPPRGRGVRQPPEEPTTAPRRPRKRLTPEEEEMEAKSGGILLDPVEAEQLRMSRVKEHKVSSSNVYSFRFVKEGRFDGALYVTFLSWWPGKPDRGPGPGSTYGYFGVPVSKYVKFRAQATTASAGNAVWDYLRVRGKGNKARHQHPYRLVSGGAFPGGANDGVYVPRKQTRGGLRVRNLPNLQGRSNLRPKSFRVRGNPAEKITDVTGRTRFV